MCDGESEHCSQKSRVQTLHRVIPTGNSSNRESFLRNTLASNKHVHYIAGDIRGQDVLYTRSITAETCHVEYLLAKLFVIHCSF